MSELRNEKVEDNPEVALETAPVAPQKAELNPATTATPATSAAPKSPVPLDATIPQAANEDAPAVPPKTHRLLRLQFQTRITHRCPLEVVRSLFR